MRRMITEEQLRKIVREEIAKKEEIKLQNNKVKAMPKTK